MQSLVTAQPICDEDTDATSDDLKEEILEEFGSSDDTSDGELHPQLMTTSPSRRVEGSWRNVFMFNNMLNLVIMFNNMLNLVGGGGGTGIIPQ